MTDLQEMFEQVGVAFEEKEEPIDEDNDEVLQLWIEGQGPKTSGVTGRDGGPERICAFEPPDADRRVLDASEDLQQVILQATEPIGAVSKTDTIRWSNINSSCREAVRDYEENNGVTVTRVQPTGRTGVQAKVWWERDVSHRTQNILAGMDTQHLFMCTLPKEPRSIEHAHRMLKPLRAYKPGSKRQGEFFFVPVPSWQLRTINKRVKKALAPWFPDRSIPWSAKLRNRKHLRTSFTNRDGTTPHVAEELTVGPLRCRLKQVFARGEVTHPRHEPMVLEEWHRVVRNKETTHQNDAKSDTEVGAVRWVD